MDALGQIAGVVAILGGGALLIVRLQRGLDKPGARDHLTGLGNALMPLQEIFHPAAYDATAELKRRRNLVTSTPTPDGKPDLPVRVVHDATGRPCAVVIRRTTPRPRGRDAPGTRGTA